MKRGNMRKNRKTKMDIKGKTRWQKMNTFQSTANDLVLNFGLTNYLLTRKMITANSPISARFDNFIINGAQEIIEEEI